MTLILFCRLPQKTQRRLIRLLLPQGKVLVCAYMYINFYNVQFHFWLHWKSPSTKVLLCMYMYMYNLQEPIRVRASNANPLAPGRNLPKLLEIKQGYCRWLSTPTWYKALAIRLDNWNHFCSQLLTYSNCPCPLLLMYSDCPLPTPLFSTYMCSRHVGFHSRMQCSIAVGVSCSSALLDLGWKCWKG